MADLNILALQPRDKAAMLVVSTKEIFLLNLHQNRVHFPAERNAFVLDHQYGRRDVTYKPTIGYNQDRACMGNEVFQLYPPFQFVVEILPQYDYSSCSKLC